MSTVNASLHDIVKNGNLGMVKSALENGAALDLEDSDGCTPVFYAALERKSKSDTRLKSFFCHLLKCNLRSSTLVS